MLYGSSLPFYCGTRSYLDNEGMSTREQGDTSHAFLASACHEFRTHRSSPTTTRTLILPWYLAVGPHCSFGKSYAVPAHLLGKHSPVPVQIMAPGGQICLRRSKWQNGESVGNRHSSRKQACMQRAVKKRKEYVGFAWSDRFCVVSLDIHSSRIYEIIISFSSAHSNIACGWLTNAWSTLPRRRCAPSSWDKSTT